MINWDLEVYVLAIVYALGSIAVATRIAAPRMQTHCGMLPFPPGIQRATGDWTVDSFHW